VGVSTLNNSSPEDVRERTYWAARSDTSRDTPDPRRHWDLYLGTVPIVDLAAFLEGGLAEPWDPYLGHGVTDAWMLR